MLPLRYPVLRTRYEVPDTFYLSRQLDNKGDPNRERMPSPLRVAHRGMPRLAPENSLPSFALALEAGAQGLELDVHATADGVVVVHHDPALRDGTVIARATAAAITSRELAPGTTLPTLAQLCDLVAGRAELFVEVKGEGIEQAVLEVLDGY